MNGDGKIESEREKEREKAKEREKQLFIECEFQGKMNRKSSVVGVVLRM